MKRLLLLLLFPIWVQAQTNVTVRRNATTGIVSTFINPNNLDTLARGRLTGINSGDVWVWNTPLKMFTPYTLPSLSGFVPYTGATTDVNLGSNNFTISGGANVKRLILDANNNVARIFSFRTGNVQRWAFRVDGNETGANSGANLAIRRYSDAGDFIDSPLSINRATGRTTIENTMLIGSATPIAGGVGSLSPIEINGTSGGTGIAIADNNLATNAETYVAGFLNSGGFNRKAAVIAFQKGDTTTNGYFGIEAHATKITSGVGSDKFGWSFFADNGMAIFPGSGTNSFAPGYKIHRIYGYTAATSFGVGTAGTDSIEVHDNFTKQTKLIPGNYYATASSAVWNRSGTTLSPTTANDAVSVTTNGTNVNALYGSATSGSAIYGINSGSSQAAITGVAQGQASAGNFSNNTSSIATIFVKQDGSSNIAQFQSPTANVFIDNAGTVKAPSMQVTTGTNNINFGSTSNYGYMTLNGSTSLSGMVGVFGGASGNDKDLFHQVPSTGVQYFREGSNDNMTIPANGDLLIRGSNATKASGTAWINPSDSRLKTNIKPYEKGLKELLQINPKLWNYNKASGYDTTKVHLSPIAQELKKVMPEMVSTYKGKLNGKPTELLQVDASDMTWLMVKSIQELNAKIEALELRIKELEK